MILQRGFTLIELVAVLVLVGILATVALPRLTLGGNLDQRLQADNLVGLLRLAQLRAMNDPGAFEPGQDSTRCGRVVITDERFGLADGCGGSLQPSYQNEPVFQGLNHPQQIIASQPLPLVIQFGASSVGNGLLGEDAWLGRPYRERNGSLERLDAALVLSLSGASVVIEPEGYIHALP